METGQYIKDGEVTWIVTDIRDTSRAGHITLETELLPGYLKLNGATVTASEYPRLITWQKKQSDAVKSLFVYDESADTLTLPDLRERFLEGGDSVALIEAGLPNITGYFKAMYDYRTSWAGAFKQTSVARNLAQDSGSSSGNVTYSLDASESNSIYGSSSTVQPPAFTLIPQIKY